jgi:hypothetical protein
LDDTGLVLALLIPVTRDAIAALDQSDPGDAENSGGGLMARETVRRGGEFRDRTVQLEDAVGGTIVFVKGHVAPLT